MINRNLVQVVLRRKVVGEDYRSAGLRLEVGRIAASSGIEYQSTLGHHPSQQSTLCRVLITHTYIVQVMVT